MKTINKLVLVITVIIMITLAVPDAVTAAPLAEDRTVIGETYTLDNGRILDGNLNVIGGVVQIAETAVVNGDVFVLGGLMTIDGTIKGNLTAIGGTVNLNETAIIEGDLISPVSYINVNPSARIMGERIEVWNIPGFSVEQFANVRPPIFRTRSMVVLPILMQIGKLFASTLLMAALGAFLLLIMHNPAERMTRALISAPWAMLGYGALTALVMLVGGFILTITICFIPVVILVGLAFGLAALVGWLALGYELGKRIASSLFKTTWHPVLAAAVGNFLLYLVARAIHLIPCVGWFPVFIATLFGLGMAVVTLFGTYPYPRKADNDESQVVLFAHDDIERAITPVVDEPVEPLTTPEPLIDEVDLPRDIPDVVVDLDHEVLVERVEILPEVPIEDLGLGTRIDITLKDAGLTTINDVLSRLEEGDNTLLEINGFGEKSLLELKNALKTRGYSIPGQE